MIELPYSLQIGLFSVGPFINENSCSGNSRATSDIPYANMQNQYTVALQQLYVAADPPQQLDAPPSPE